jgi:hypothetical protein
MSWGRAGGSTAHPDPPVPAAQPHSGGDGPVPQAGRYRVRASVYAVNSDDKPLPMRCVVDHQYGRDEADVRAVRDVPAGKATVIEGEFDLKDRQHVVFVGWSLPKMGGFGMKPIDLKTAPGFAIEWLEIEGPINLWPPQGYERLFPACRSSSSRWRGPKRRVSRSRNSLQRNRSTPASTILWSRPRPNRTRTPSA